MRMKSKRSSLVFAVVLATIALAGVGVVLFLYKGAVIRAKMEDEVFKLSYQFLLITVIGGALSLLYQRFSAERALTEKRNALLREMHSELLNAYNIAKRARRMLRAHVGSLVTPESRLRASRYDEEIDKIMDAQLTFEVYAKRAGNAGLWFRNGKALGVELNKVEGYLNSLIKEYEDKRSTFAGKPPSQALSELKTLAEFVGPYKDATGFKDSFKVPFRKALTLLVESEFI